MRLFFEQRKAAADDQPLSSIVFAEIVAMDEDNRLLKIVIQPWEIETGWCKCLMDTFYPFRRHKTHATHDTHMEHVPPGPLQPHDEHEDHTPHLPLWPYKVGQEVLAAAVQGSNGSEQYVVLGLIDKGPLTADTEPRLLEFEE